MRDSRAGLCLPLEQLGLYSESSPCLRKRDAIGPFLHASELSFRLLYSAYSGFSRGFSRCLPACGWAPEPPKPNSDISWPTVLVVREKYPAGRRSLLSPRRKASFALTGAVDWKDSAWSHRGVCVLKYYKPSAAASVSCKGVSV